MPFFCQVLLSETLLLYLNLGGGFVGSKGALVSWTSPSSTAALANELPLPFDLLQGLLCCVF